MKNKKRLISLAAQMSFINFIKAGSYVQLANQN